MNKSRRKLIMGASAGLVAGSVSARSFTNNFHKEISNTALSVDAISNMQWSVSIRTRDNYRRRVQAIGANLLDGVNLADQPVNLDELEIPSYVGNFSKTLHHNSLGEVDQSAYLSLIDGLANNDMSNITLSKEADRKLANPSAYRSLELYGGYPELTRITKSPDTQGAHAAAEMIEVYWQALTRDIPFSQYSSSSMISSAVEDMNNASYDIGPLTNGSVTTSNIFRGSTFGDLEGPYISQLLLLPFQYGASNIEQKYSQPTANLDFMTSFDEFLAIQNGAAPSAQQTYGSMRYIQNNRDLANYVHSDVLFQAYYNATMILLQSGGLVTSGLPFSGSDVESGFVTFGGPDILNMVTSAAHMALTGAWYQKWLHRKLRPEAYAGLVDVQRRGLADYGLHSDIMNSEAVASTIATQGNALLSQAYPEGSPTHPAYPAGHACVSGACTTILKAWFNEEAIFPNPKVPNSTGSILESLQNVNLTVGGEINKLANNIAIGRNAAGVHYRSDGEQGMFAGEQQAIALLRDYTFSYINDFNGFYLTKFDGTKIRIVNGTVSEV